MSFTAKAELGKGQTITLEWRYDPEEAQDLTDQGLVK